MKIKKYFEEPKLDVIKFEATDIITTSVEYPKLEAPPTPELTKFSIFG